MANVDHLHSITFQNKDHNRFTNILQFVHKATSTYRRCGYMQSSRLFIVSVFIHLVLYIEISVLPRQTFNVH